MAARADRTRAGNGILKNLAKHHEGAKSMKERQSEGATNTAPLLPAFASTDSRPPIPARPGPYSLSSFVPFAPFVVLLSLQAFTAYCDPRTAPRLARCRIIPPLFACISLH
jgi:hypothetical protein